VGLVSIHQEALHKPCYAQINCKQATHSGDYYLLLTTAESPRRITFMGCPVALSAAMDQERGQNSQLRLSFEHGCCNFDIRTSTFSLSRRFCSSIWSPPHVFSACRHSTTKVQSSLMWGRALPPCLCLQHQQHARAKEVRTPESEGGGPNLNAK